jgi:hypothetical protein
MPWAPGQSGNPNGHKHVGPREQYRREIWKQIEGLGHKDVLVTLSTIQNDEKNDVGFRVAAASALAPYVHPKMQSTPTPRFIDLQIDIPEFTHVSEAESFLAKIALLCARGHLDIQSAQELSALVKLWIDSQYQKDELQLKINPPETRDTTITVVGGLPALPGTTITMPQLNGHVADAHALAAPTDVVPAPNDSVLPIPGELKAIGPHPLQKHHFEEPKTESTNGQGPQAARAACDTTDQPTTCAAGGHGLE